MLRIMVKGRYEERALAEHVVAMAQAFNVTLPATAVGGDPVDARYDHGRWLADCPVCKVGAESVDPDDLRFFCFNCAAVGAGSWRPVVLPDDHQAIEAALSERPEQHQHWRPGATLDDLKTENLLHSAW